MVEFKQLGLYSFDCDLIVKDPIQCLDYEHIKEKIQEFVRNKVFPKMLEFNSSTLEWTVVSTQKEVISCRASYCYDNRVILAIGFSPLLSQCMINRQSSVRTDLNSMFEDLEKEFNILKEENNNV